MAQQRFGISYHYQKVADVNVFYHTEIAALIKKFLKDNKIK